MKIRPERAEDFASVEQVIRLAFGTEGEVTLVNELRREPGFVAEHSLVAEEETTGQVVGHIFFSPITIDQTPGLALAPLAVLPEFQKSGVGKQLVWLGLAEARQQGHTLVVVVGHPEYYPKFGFVPARRFGLEAPFPVSDEAFMVCELTPGALAGVSGMVHYAAPFGRL